MTDTTTGLYTTGEVPGVAEGLTVADGLFAIADALFGLYPKTGAETEALPTGR